MSGYANRLKTFEEVLIEDDIDFKKLRLLCFNGIPEEKGLRPLCWKLLLNYLPPRKSSWNKTLLLKRELYNHFIEDLIVSPGDRPTENISNVDHPLNNNPDSEWNTYFKDNDVLLQIDKDVRRLNPEISFFQQATDYPCDTVVNSNGRKRLHTRVQYCTLNSANVERKGLGPTKIASASRKSDDYVPLEEGSEAHWEVVERILFIYAKLNPGQGYVQGMNEIIGPIYYCFACNPITEWKRNAEADCFFAFTNLMGEIRDFFIKSLDDADTGISRLMERLLNKVRLIDHAVYNRLNQLQLHPQYYSFRWLTLLLSQEFPLPDVLRIWDSIFAEEDKFSFLLYICCAMIVLIRSQLLSGDFSTNVKLLQNYPSTDIQIVLNKAVELANKDREKY